MPAPEQGSEGGGAGGSPAEPDVRILDVADDSAEERYCTHESAVRQGRLGPGKDDAKEILFFNRVVRYTNVGLEYEADPRQGERLLESLGLDENCNPTG